MRTFGGKLAGRSWLGYVADRPEDLPLFLDWVRRQPYVAADIEGKGLDILSNGPDYTRLVQMGNETEAWAIPIELGQQFKDATREALEVVPSVVGHNFIGFDAPALNVSLGLDFDALARKTTDTLLISKLIDPRSKREGSLGHGLKDLSAHYLDPTAPDTSGDLTSVFRGLGMTKDSGWAGIDLFHPTYLEYGLLDVILSARLLPKLEAEARRVGVRPALIPYEHDIARICATMSLRGFLMDRPYTEELSAEFQREAEKFSAVAARYGVAKIGAPKQIAQALLGMGEELTATTASGALKVDKDVLSALADLNKDGERIGARTPNPLAAAIIKAKRATKWRTAYAEHFLSSADENDRLHPRFNTLAARTGRMSVTDPAAQTLPSGDWRIRRALIADPGEVIISTDFDSVELNVMAALADVKKMKEAIFRGEKLHKTTARLVFGDNYTDKQYKIAKIENFLKAYGGGIQAAITQTGADPAILREFDRQFDRAYPELKAYGRRLQREAFDNGMVIRSLTGRILPLDRDRTYAALNYVTQSTARDCLGQALITMDAQGVTPHLRLAVHDEVVASVPNDIAGDVSEVFRSAMNFSLLGVPISATPDTYGASWGHGYMSDDEKLRDDSVMAA